MIYTKVAAVVAAGFIPAATFDDLQSGDTPLQKLTVKVYGADVRMQPTEDPQGAFSENATHEIYLEKGAHSLVPVTPWYGFRFKLAQPGGQASVNFIAYA